jgi:hypothetical protein
MANEGGAAAGGGGVQRKQEGEQDPRLRLPGEEPARKVQKYDSKDSFAGLDLDRIVGDSGDGDDKVLDALEGSCSENNVDVDTDDGASFEAEVARRSKFIAKGGCHSIKKVLAGEARAGMSGPARFDRRRLPARADSNEDGPVPAKVVQPIRAPPKDAPRAPLRSISVDSTDSQIEDEADRRSRFMVKGGSHSIRNLFQGKTKKEKGANRFDRRKLHFKKESEAVAYAEKPHMKPAQINQARLKAEEEAKAAAAARKAAKAAAKEPRRAGTRPSLTRIPAPAPEADEEPSSTHPDDDDAALEAEADIRSKYMVKGGSHSIRNLFAGKGTKSGGGGGLSRFNRRKMHFKKESEAVHYIEKPHLKPAEINKRHQQEAARLREEETKAPRVPKRSCSTDNDEVDIGDEVSKEAIDAEIDRLHGDGSEDAGVEGSDDEDPDLEEEADRRSKFMMKGGSYSIQKVLKGEARAKKGITRFDRRKMHFKKESAAVHSHDGDGGQQACPENDAGGAKGKQPVSINNKASENGEPEKFEDKDDADLLEEADRRSNFMMKGGSYSIQKVIRGEARAKKGVTRFDRRKMHFKKESEAVHSHDKKEAPPTRDREGGSSSSAPKLPHRRVSAEEHADEAAVVSSATDSGADKDADNNKDDDEEEEDFTEEDLELLAEADERHQMMLKGASHSIRNIFSGKARKKSAPVSAGFQRRTSRLKQHPAAATTPTKPSATAKPEAKEEEPSESVFDEEPSVSAIDDDKVDRRSRFSLKGASHSIRNLLSGKKGKRKSEIDAEIERLHEDDANDNAADMDDEDREIAEEANRRSKFIAKGGSYSINKVLSGNARKKKEGITRFDRRKMHFKKESEAAQSAGGSPSKESSPPKAADAMQAEVKAAEPPKPDPEASEKSADWPGKASEEAAEEAPADDEDADIEDEADRRSKFILKGASYSIQKVLSGNARKKKETVSRFDRRKMHFKKGEGRSEASQSRDDENPTPAEPASSPSEPPAASADTLDSGNAKPPSRRVSDDVNDEEFDDEDLELLAQADERSKLMLKGGSHSIRNMFSGKTKKKENEGTGFNRRLSHLKTEAVSLKSTPAGSSKASPGKDSEPEPIDSSTQGSTVLEPTPSPKKDDAKTDVPPAADEDDGEEVDMRKRFSLKGASHSIKKVLAGKARSSRSNTGSGVNRFDRRKMHFKKSGRNADEGQPSGGKDVRTDASFDLICSISSHIFRQL